MKVSFGGSNQLQNGITLTFVGVRVLCKSKFNMPRYVYSNRDQGWRLRKLKTR